jgi:hypothetical protein
MKEEVKKLRELMDVYGIQPTFQTAADVSCGGKQTRSGDVTF